MTMAHSPDMTGDTTHRPEYPDRRINKASKKAEMGTKIFLGLTGAAIGFMAYVLFNFAKEGRQARPRNRPMVTIAVLRPTQAEEQNRSKAA